MTQSNVMVTKPWWVLPMFVCVCVCGQVLFVCLQCITHKIVYPKLEIQSDSCQYFCLSFISTCYFNLKKKSGRSQSVAVFLLCDLPFCEPSKGYPEQKPPSRHVANGLTKHDKHPLLPCSTLHPVAAFVLPIAVGLDCCEGFPSINWILDFVVSSLPSFISSLLFIVKSVAPSIGPRLTQIPMQLPPLPLTSYQNTSRLLLFLLFNMSLLHQILHPQLWLCEIFCC